MTTIIWITGRAATGKSTVIAAVDHALRTRGSTPTVLCDERILLDLVAADTEHRHHHHPYGDTRFAFHDGHLFDQAVRAINTQLTAMVDRGDDGVVLVELARGVPGPVDVSYQRALELIEPRLWAHSTVYRLHTLFGTQLRRNHARTQRTGRGVPEQVMRSLYHRDDPAAFTRAGIRVLSLPADNTPTHNAELILTNTTTSATPARPTAQHLPHRSMLTRRTRSRHHNRAGTG